MSATVGRGRSRDGERTRLRLTQQMRPGSGRDLYLSVYRPHIAGRARAGRCVVRHGPFSPRSFRAGEW